MTVAFFAPCRNILTYLLTLQPGPLGHWYRLAGYTPWHICWHVQDNFYDIGGGDQFQSLAELVDYYRNNPMVERSGTVVHLKQVGHC